MAIEFKNLHWGNLIREKLQQRNWRQVDLAAKLGHSKGSTRMLLQRERIKLSTIQFISQALGEDLSIHLLSESSQATLKNAREAGIEADTPAEALKNIHYLLTQVEVDSEGRFPNLIEQLQQARAESASLKQALQTAQDHSQELQSQQDQHETHLQEQQAQFTQTHNQQEEAHRQELAAQENRIQALERELQQYQEERRKLEHEHELRVAVLEAKLEVYQKVQGS